MSQPYGQQPDPRQQQWGPPQHWGPPQPPPSGQWQWVPEQPPAPATPKTNAVAIIGLVFGVLGLLAWWGFASWLAAAPFGLIALVLGLTGDVLSRRGYAGQRMGILAALLGLVCLAPMAAALF